MPGEEDAVNGPSEAFGLLANGQRMAIMEALWGRREPVPFKALKAAAGVEDSGRFNYHLGKLGGTYVRKADDGYELTRPGRRVITAVRGGDLLDRPDVGPAEVDWPCPRCGADLELGSSGDVIRVLCNECPGLFRGGSLGRRPRREHPGGTVSILPIPPVGFENRSPTEVLEAAVRWILHRATMQSDGVCPDCSAAVSTELFVCADHEPGDTLCPSCDGLYAVRADVTCDTCGSGMTNVVAAFLRTHPRLAEFFLDHGVDITVIEPESVTALVDYDEEVRSVDPLDYELRWTMEGETLRLAVDENLEVTSVSRGGD